MRNPYFVILLLCHFFLLSSAQNNSILDSFGGLTSLPTCAVSVPPPNTPGGSISLSIATMR
ncbi:hypothetical protein BGZ60DRAFT_416046 [Tricladium varicosporioides]|nr:hypothetical protein BGZ60DRAFT_416046 [Hymenoscyphus varicosporioides]